MNVDFFIKQIAMNKDKDSYIDTKIMTTKYVPYEEKNAKCESILKSTSVIKDETTGIEIYKRNTPAFNVFYNMTLISLYTNIEVDFEHILKDYNALEELGYIDLLLSHIPKQEYTAWSRMCQMVMDDYMENNRSLIAYLDNKLGAIDKTAESIAEVIKGIETEINKE